MSKYKLFLPVVSLVSILLLVRNTGNAQCNFNSYSLSPSGYVCGSNTSVTLSGSQSGISYQLTGGGGNVGTPVAGTGSALSWSNVPIVNGSYVVYGIKSGCSNTVVASTSIFSIPPLTTNQVTISATNNGILCSGGSVTLTANVPQASGRTNVTYQWFNHHGPPISGQTSASFTASTAGIYDVLVSCNCGSAMVSSPEIIAGGSSPTAPGPVTGSTTIANGTITQSVYTISASGNATGYQWSLSNPSAGTVVPNGTNATITWNPDFVGTVTVNAAATSTCGNTPATGLNVSLLRRITVSNDQNYIFTRDVLKSGITNISNFNTLADQEVRAQITYFDGLGRPMQNIAIAGSPDAKDIVTPVAYDLFGRQDKSYLPYAATGATGTFKNNAVSDQSTFYQQDNGPSIPQITGNPFSQTVFENSPLNRPLEQGFPGQTWAAGNGHTVKTAYPLNIATDDVKIWDVTISTTPGVFSTYTMTGTYSAGQLYKNITTDENGKQVIEFKDKEGKVVLKKVQLTATADDGTTGSGYSGWLCTYYIYDDYEQLRAVIQPEGVKQLATSSWQLTTTLLTEQCFRYEYDDHNRMTMKKVPGAGEVYMVYDARDRLVMNQDANLRSINKWMVTKYDALNRPVETGLWISATSFSDHLSGAYNSTTYPATASNYESVTLTHYDDYSSLPAGLSSSLNESGYGSYLNAAASAPEYAMPVTQSTNVKGLVTWTQVKVLGTTSQFNSSVIIYDSRARIIQSQAINITGGLDIVTNQYSFTGQLLRNHLKHQKLGGTTQIYETATKNNYDDWGRISSVQKIIAGSAWKTISAMEYNAVGQLKTKKLGTNPVNTSLPLETLNYEYNSRGWLLGMNRNFAKDANNDNYFGFDLGYDKADNGIIGSQTYSNPQYNGNIEGMVWKSKGDGEKRKYDFSYDAANRLMKADFTQYTGGTFNQNAGVNYNMKMGDGIDPTLAYDANGNIKRMQQWGLKITGSAQIDDLNYQYISGSNKLLSVTEATLGTTDNKLGDFTDRNTTNDDYSYDVNGNLNLDKNKNISSITYNYINLPSIITVTGKGTITYVYDAAGNKLQKITVESNATVPYNGTNYTTNITTTTTYIGSFVYESKSYSNSSLSPLQYADKLQFAAQEEGRIRPAFDASNNITGFAYDYFLKDHLGNVRMVLTEEQKIDKYPVASLEDSKVTTEDNYYTIDNTKIVAGNTVTGLPTYTNDNGIGNNPPDASFEAANSTKLYKLNATTNKTGLGMTLKVMAGDKIDIFGKSYYFQNNTGGSGANSSIPFTEILNGLAGSPAGTLGAAGHGDVTGTQLSGLSATTSGIQTLFTNETTQNNNNTLIPKAYINYLFFDEQFKCVGSGFSSVGSNSSIKDHHSELQNIAVPKNGYVYIYCSNESPVNVFFDNLQVVHTRGPIVEETHYYPFGLTMQGISSKALSFGGAENKYKYNAKELQSKEFTDGSGLELYDFGARQHDPQIGRWTTIDPLAQKRCWVTPYNYVQNNPINRFDPNGLTDYTLDKKTGDIKQVGEKNDDPDRILKTNRKGEVKYKKNGEAKVAIDGIEQGILKDGMNFQKNDNLIAVGGKGQPTENGVEAFALKLSGYVGKEIGGAYFSKDGATSTTHISIGKYKDNDMTTTKANGNNLWTYFHGSDETNKYTLTGFFHTHPSTNINVSDRTVPSDQDLSGRDSDHKLNPNLKYYILTDPLNYGDPYPYKIDYTTGFSYRLR